jgi:hypothetical protein
MAQRVSTSSRSLNPLGGRLYVGFRVESSLINVFASEAQISEVPRKFRVEVRAVSWDTRVCQVWTKARLVQK